MAKICGVCGKKLGFLSISCDIKAGTICSSCFGAISDYRWKKDGESMVALFADDGYIFEDYKKELAESKLAPQSLQKRINDFGATETLDTVHFNDNTNSILIETSNVQAEVFKYEQIIGFELIENGNSIISGGAGQAIAGGMLFGEVGAIIGGTTATRKMSEICTLLKIKITFRNCNRRSIDITFIDNSKGFQKNSYEYTAKFELAEEIMTALQVAVDKVKVSEVSTKTSAADEILKYKNLLDLGAISEDEYNAKKLNCLVCNINQM